MPIRVHKLAKDLTEGDRIQRKQDVVEVVSVEPSVQTIKRAVRLVTIRLANGRTTHATYYDHATVNLVVEEGAPS